MNTREAKIAAKRQILEKLLREFPWLWAIRDCWSFDLTDPLPTVKVVKAGSLSTSGLYNRREEWWVVYRSADHAKDRLVFSVEELQFLSDLHGVKESLGRDVHGLFLVTRKVADPPQRLTIYKRPKGKTIGDLLD